jgi:hypothetical protein
MTLSQPIANGELHDNLNTLSEASRRSRASAQAAFS